MNALFGLVIEPAIVEKLDFYVLTRPRTALPIAGPGSQKFTVVTAVEKFVPRLTASIKLVIEQHPTLPLTRKRQAPFFGRVVVPAL